MQKAHDSSKNSYWKNYPDVSTPIVQDELNRNEQTVDTLDDRIIVLDSTKANQSDLLQSLKTVSYNSTTGVFVFTFWNGTTVRADLNIEQIPVSFSMSAQGVITMTTADGTQYTADVSTLIKTYSFVDSDEIHIATTTDASGNKTVTASIISGSITADKLQPNYLADITTQASRSTTAAATATTASNNSQAFATGQIDGADVPATHPAYHNNAKYYAEQASGAVAGVASFNARAGAVIPQDGDYAIGQIAPTNGTAGQVPTVEMVNGQPKLVMADPPSTTQVQSDWEQADDTKPDFIKNKPTIPSDNKTKQTITTTNANYDLLMSYTADDTTRTEGARKAANLKFNPSTGNLQTTQLNGQNVGDSPKFTDTTYSQGNGITIDNNNAISADFGTTAGKVCQGNDSRLSNARTPTAHNQGASTITAGTLGGQVVANADAVKALATKQVRNIYFGTDALTSSDTLAQGDMYFQYEVVT